MASSVRHPDEAREGNLTFLRPLPGILPPPAEPRSGESARFPTTDDLSPSQLLQRLFPTTTQGDSTFFPPVTGLELGHFVLQERIGRGGMGAVFRALDRSLDRVVALKVLSPEQSADPASVQRFHNEARAAAQLDHNNIARVHYIGRDRGAHFIAFEYVVGTTIRDLIVQRGRIAPPDAINYTLQVVEALRHTAAAAVVHRDIKPSNIIVTPTGRAKLVDLGLARQSHSQDDDLTVAGTALGTFDYIAPEQALDARNVDVRSDIYSLGCTLYHMLTGEPPFPKGSMFEKVMNHHRAAPPDPCARNPEVPAELGKVVQKMMASRPDERYASPDHVGQELARIALTWGMRALPIEAPVWSSLAQTAARGSWEGLQIWMAVSILLLGLVMIIDKLPWGQTPAAQLSQTAGTDRPGPAEFASPPVTANEQSPLLGADSQADAFRSNFTNLNAQHSPANGDAPRVHATSPLAADFPVAADTTAAGNPTLQPLPQPDAFAAEVGIGLAGSLEQLRTGMAGLGVKIPPPMISRPSPAIDSGATITVPTPDIIPSNSATATAAATTSNPPGLSSPEVAATSSPFLVIPAVGPSQTFESLAEACFDAPDGAIIELRFNGRLSRFQPPFRLTGKRLTVRPASGFRPVLTFALDTGVLPGDQGVSMIAVNGAALDIYNCDIEMQVDPRRVADQWSLFSCSGAAQLELVGVSLTIANPQRVPAAFIDIPLREGAELAETMPDKMYREPLEVRLLNAIVRGQGDLVIQRNADPLLLEFTNLAAAITGTALRLAGEQVFSMAMREAEQSVSATLRHVTLVSQQGLLAADSGDQGQFLPIRLDVRDSVCSVREPGHPLLALAGHEEFEDLQSRMTWVNTRSGNFFELTGPVWQIRSPQSPFQAGQDYALVQWNEYWGQAGDRQASGQLFRQTRFPELDQFHRFDRADFLLFGVDALENSAIGAATDRRDAGVDWAQNQLPPQFPEVEPIAPK